ncbi:MAG: GxxExxY protein [Ignavibacteriales bacterium]|nr:GxxExxY protein [Ignavibacteriales bacterium]
MDENEISAILVDVAYELHSSLGPGLLESVYQELYVFKIRERGLDVKTQIELPIIFEGKKFSSTFRLDILVEDKVIVELKSVEQLLPVHKKQLLTYLSLSDKKLGLLINFGSALIKDGIKRVVNNL